MSALRGESLLVGQAGPGRRVVDRGGQKKEIKDNGVIYIFLANVSFSIFVTKLLSLHLPALANQLVVLSQNK